MNGASDNIIGGVKPGEGNVISDNANEGILDTFSSHDNTPVPSQGNIIQGNFIGTDANGTEPHGNGKNGIKLDEYAINNINWRNRKWCRKHYCIQRKFRCLMCRNNTIPVPEIVILSNSIHSNTGLGIDLGTDGVTTANDNGDSDIGANNLQNFPVLTSVSFSPGNVRITGSLNSKSGQTYTIQFFTSKVADEID